MNCHFRSIESLFLCDPTLTGRIILNDLKTSDMLSSTALSFSVTQYVTAQTFAKFRQKERMDVRAETQALSS